ncbi:type I-F CRISPR-associated endoribonuclease Cas6/Csy4 [Ketobacter sp. MCCC 1A13808]|uniref:type I-F CRISPR-associated endoribonuclease Cas6/Csy4 n=1 Tax=Ketobacter sp. MCCC 1A13808 TaxID=2602738 RepID=UPI0012EB22BA|nr:type I-F CRISPR-associated endoribonuclease Cas6/Csy4 [Ketobacter sp. MCCC 1A13808]MVF12274.1 type I-F CRISPR-associated endoribonuclease Cas6/Csy4 [Ketobacter sp. MCCC 1A13808]
MDHHIDIQVLPDPEFKETVLMNALYSKLHRILGQKAEGRIGVSFPNYDKTLGGLLRLHGTSQDLKRLMEEAWMTGLRDYCTTSEIQEIPGQHKHCIVKRVQAKSAHNKRSRSIRKGWLTESEAFTKIPETQQKALQLPFAQLRSLSNDNLMRVYIEHGSLKDQPMTGTYSSYGLSSSATVPWF